MNLNEVKVVGPRLLLELEEPEDMEAKRAAASGLVIVRKDTAKPRPTTGVVVAVGTDPLIQQWQVQVGTRLSFASTAGDRQLLEGKEYRLIELQEIKMILPALQAPTE